MLARVAKIHTDGDSLERQHLVVEDLEIELLINLDQRTYCIVRHVLVIYITVPERVENIAEVMGLNNTDTIIREEFLEPGHNIFLVVDMRNGIIAERDFCLAVLRGDPLRQRFAKKFADSLDAMALSYRRDILGRLNIEN